MALEKNFDIPFTAALAKKEKQIQQNYRPIIGIHKWFARRPGTVFRSLLLSEYNGNEAIESGFWKSHDFKGIIADPFMGGGTPIFEANRLGFSVIGADINPMAFWIVRQSLAPINIDAFIEEARKVINDVDKDTKTLYQTRCNNCGKIAEIKYFIWVKTQACPECGEINDLFPGYLLAEDSRHPKNVIICPHCGDLNECDQKPHKDSRNKCQACNKPIFIEGPAKNNHIACNSCGHKYKYPPPNPMGPPEHRMWAIEYHCRKCKPSHKGRFFKRPDDDDLKRFKQAKKRFNSVYKDLPIPTDEIPIGDETKRLHRWGYKYFREMFNARQLLGLGILFQRILKVDVADVRHALLTVFSDFLRYQNMLARYDTYALKCQDIFSVHGFPVGLVQCENNLLGIAKVGSGAYRHFIEKYVKAKQYCEQPFETQNNGYKKKKLVPIAGELIKAKFVDQFPGHDREAWISSISAEEIALRSKSLDGVFTDPPYFDNVQYAELMDFCYAWLRLALGKEFKAFRPTTTRTLEELTGNDTMGRGLEHFTEGLSRIFCHYASALKKGAPFVFTFHHNDPQAYTPLIVAILDANLFCNATLPVPGEMNASLHIARTKSSILDTVFVCRSTNGGRQTVDIGNKLANDMKLLKSAGLNPSEGDIRCLASGHIARVAINKLKSKWHPEESLKDRMSTVGNLVKGFVEQIQLDSLISELQTEAD